jgi:hypothetical protein
MVIFHADGAINHNQPIPTRPWVEKRAAGYEVALGHGWLASSCQSFQYSSSPASYQVWLSTYVNVPTTAAHQACPDVHQMQDYHYLPSIIRWCGTLLTLQGCTAVYDTVKSNTAYLAHPELTVQHAVKDFLTSLGLFLHNKVKPPPALIGMQDSRSDHQQRWQGSM